jgi:hypothetical protein
VAVAARHIRTRCEEVWIRSGDSGGRRRGVAGVGEERGGDGDKAAIIEGFVRFFFGFLYFSFVSAVLQAKRVYRWAELGC